MLTGWPTALTASAFNQLSEYASSSGNRVDSPSLP